MRLSISLLTALLLTTGFIGAQHLPPNDSLALLPAHERLLALNVFMVEYRENEAGKEDAIRRLHPLADSLDDTRLREYLDFYKFVLPALAWEDSDMCIRILTRASEHYTVRGKKLFTGIALHMIGQHHYMWENFGPAFEYLLKANDLFQQSGYANIPEIGRYLHEMALAHYYFRDYQKVLELMRASISLPAYNKNLDMQRNNNLALAHRNTEQSDSALFYFERTLELARQYQDSVWISIAYGNIGGVYHNQGRYDLALKYREADHKYRLSVTSIPGFTKMSALGLAETWLKLGQLEKAKYYLRSYREAEEQASTAYSGRQYEKTIRKSFLRVAHQYYNATGDYRIAYRYLDSLRMATAEEDLVYHKLITTTAQQRIDLLQQQSSIEMLRQDQQHQKVRYGLLIAALCLLIAVFALLYYLTRLRKEREKAEHLVRQKTLELEKIYIGKELSKARQELRERLNQIQEKEGLIEQLNTDLKILQKDDSSPNGRISETEKNLRDIRILTDRHWEDFQQQFEASYKDISQQLREIRPQLTRAETRFFMLSAIGLSEQEMALALGVLPDTIRMIRHRIKKKYGKPASELIPVDTDHRLFH